MNWLVNNWYILVAVIAIVVMCIMSVIKFFNLPTEAQIANFKEWLKWAVAQAEEELGGGTGQLKLRFVYEMAVKNFTWIKDVLPFDTFSAWVDEALSWLNKQLESNKAVRAIIVDHEREEK